MDGSSLAVRRIQADQVDAFLRISMNRDSDFSKSRTSISLSRGQRARSSSASLVAVRGD